MKEQNQLRRALSLLEKLSKSLFNLRKLEKSGDISKDECQEYEEIYLTEQQNQDRIIDSIHETLKGKLDRKKDELSILEKSLRDISIRFKVGEQPITEYNKMREALSQKKVKTKETIQTIERILAAKTSADLGGYIDLPVGKNKSSFNISALSIPSIDLSGLNFIKPTYLPLICGIIMVITPFLPWASVDGGAGKENIIGTVNSYGNLCLFMGLIAAGSTFIDNKNIKGLAHIITGALSIVFIFGYWNALLTHPISTFIKNLYRPEFCLFAFGAAALITFLYGIKERVQA